MNYRFEDQGIYLNSDKSSVVPLYASKKTGVFTTEHKVMSDAGLL